MGRLVLVVGGTELVIADSISYGAWTRLRDAVSAMWQEEGKTHQTSAYILRRVSPVSSREWFRVEYHSPCAVVGCDEYAELGDSVCSYHATSRG